MEAFPYALSENQQRLKDLEFAKERYTKVNECIKELEDLENVEKWNNHSSKSHNNPIYMLYQGLLNQIMELCSERNLLDILTTELEERKRRKQ